MGRVHCRQMVETDVDGRVCPVTVYANRDRRAGWGWTAAQQGETWDGYTWPTAEQALDGYQDRLNRREAIWAARGVGPALTATRSAAVEAAGGELAYTLAVVEQVRLADGPALQQMVPGVAPTPFSQRMIAQELQRRTARRGDAPLPSGGLFDDVARAQQDLFA